ncbi:MAG: PKD domain-containing protein [Flavobacteriales bacterium]|nr:PKD domain-containing protein [Flavobacteriales bacterium]
MRITTALIVLLLFSLDFRSQIDPDDLPGLVTWLRADSVSLSAGAVDTIFDLSASGNHAVESDPALMPLWIESDPEIAGNPTVRFDGVNDGLSLNTAVNVGHVFLVADYEAEVFDDFDGLLTAQSGGAGLIMFQGDQGSTQLFAGGYFGADIQNNGVFTNDFAPLENYHVYGGSKEVPTSTTLRLAKNRNFTSGRFWQGDICELIIYEAPLTSEEEQGVLDYIYLRYGAQVVLPDDLIIEEGFCDTLLAAAPGFSSYDWSTGSDSSSTLISSSGIYTLTVQDVFGSESSDSIEVLYPGNFIDPFTLCAGSDSLWDTGLDDPQYNLTWNVPNSGPSLLIQDGGDYQVQVVDGEGCIYESDTVQVTLDTYPITTTLGPDTQLCAGNEIALISGADSTVSYLWDDASELPSLEVLTSDEYYVEATNINACVAYDTILVTILGEAPLAIFGYSNTCFNEQVQFVDNSIAPDGAVIDEFLWQFGDGGESILDNPTYQYAATDTFLVSLFITTDQGCSDAIEQQVVISPLPQAEFSNGPLCHQQEVLFEDVSVVESGVIQDIEWLFNGVQTFTGPIVSFIYDDPGDFDIRLIVETQAGCRDTISETLTVNGTPTSSFEAETVCLGNPTVFTADPDESLSGPVNQFFWDFGGATSIFETTTYTIPNTGPNEVSLTVTSALGCVDDTTAVVFVADDPEVGFEYGLSCVDQPVQFADTSILFPGDSVLAYTWFFANIEGSTDSTPSYTFENPGIFDVSLNVETTAGCEGQFETQIQIAPLPISSFSMIPNIGSPPFTPEFENFSEGASDYVWTLDFGQQNFDSIPNHTFTDSGLVNVSLEVFNEAGCSDISSQPIFLTEPLVDLVLLDMEYIIVEDFLYPILSIRNLGNYDLEEFTIEIEFTEGPLVQEQWTGLLPRNGAILYTMSAGVYFEESLPFFCVRLIPPDQRVDQEPANNELCQEIGTVGEEVYMIGPYPNPVSDKLSFTLINLGNQELMAQIVDMSGRVIVDRQLTNSGELVQAYEMDLSALDNGRYLLRLNIGLETQVFKLQVLDD